MNKITLYELLGITALILTGGILATLDWHTTGGGFTGVGLVLMWLRK